MLNVIKELLKTNNCVIIPGFGAFVANYTAAEVRLYEQKIYPPSKSIAFNRALQANDGLLVNAVARQLAVSYDEAESKVASFSKQCNDTLSNHKSLILNGIGKWTLDNEQHIQFQSTLSENFLLSSFALQALPLHPVQRLRGAEPELQESYQRIMHPEKLGDVFMPRRTKGKASYWVTAFLAMAFLSLSVGWNLQKVDTYRESASLMPSFKTIVSKKEDQKIVAELAPAPIEEIAAQPESTLIPVLALTPVVAVPVAPIVSDSYIVIGAFFDEARALKLQQEAVHKGYETTVQRDANNIYRVAVKAADSTVSATLQMVKQQLNARAWVYCTNCNF